MKAIGFPVTAPTFGRHFAKAVAANCDKSLLPVLGRPTGNTWLRRQRLQQQWLEWRRFRRWRRRELVALVERDRDAASRPIADTNLTHFPAR